MLNRVAVPQVLQKKKSFPFGTAVNCWKYNANAAGGKYRDFIHRHFNWVVPENALKWMIIEPQRVRLCVTEVKLCHARCVAFMYIYIWLHPVTALGFS